MSEADEPRSGEWLRPLLAFAAFMALNLLVWQLLPKAWIEALGQFGYPGAVLVTLVANATVFVPVPYFPVVIRLAEVLNPLLVTLCAAAGSALGESAGFFVGRSGRGAARQTRLYRWTQRQLQQRWRAPLVLFALSAPPNPTFDVAGLLAGALGVPLWVFLISVFCGRIIRMGIVIWIGLTLAGA